MSLDAKKLAELEKPLDPKHVSERAQAGRKFSYIEGHHAIREANRIFGHDQWTRETSDTRMVDQREVMLGKQGSEYPGWSVTYICRVRVCVGELVREGTGAGHGKDRDLGQAHESAIKEAETDAMKRALMTFGDPFGLALYDKQKRHVEDPEAAERKAQAEAAAEAKRSAKVRKGAETFAASMITALTGQGREGAELILDNYRAKLAKLQKEHPDLCDPINALILQAHERADDGDVLAETQSGMAPQAPRHLNGNGAHHGG